MMEVGLVLLNLSERSNKWNRLAIEMARRDIRGFSFDDFYRSRQIGIVSRNRWDYYAKSFVVGIMVPYYRMVYNSLRK